MGTMQKLAVPPGKHYLCIVFHGELCLSSVQAGGSKGALPSQAACGHYGF